MLYRKDRAGRQLSQLGYGCMRFSHKGAGIDFPKAEREVLRAIELGVNYFDTAYIYPGSEECLGKILAKNQVREQVYIATKLPQYLMRSLDQVEKTFNEELDRLQTDYVDYYLMHMFTDYAEWERLQALGIEAWVEKKRAQGKIRCFGFSYHGDSDAFIQLLNAYDWDFCQIQYNYLDEHSQAGRCGLEAAAAKGIPVIIMEPLRGGKLVNIPPDAKQILAQHPKHYTAAELGLRWLWNQSGVTVVLSGMNSLEMLEENVRVASDAAPDMFTQQDLALVDSVKSSICKHEKVGCTSCRYCMPCPKGVDIPGNFYYYNLMYIEKKMEGRAGFAQNMGLRREPGFASQCVGCGKCEKHCPQHLPIRELLKEADKELRPFYIRAGIAVVRKAMSKGK